MYIIYRITNVINNNTYIGQHKVKSILTDDGYLGSGKLIKRALLKYGKKSFKKEIITFAISHLEANTLEKYYISKEKPVYNISPGGNGGNVNKNGIPWNKGKKGCQVAWNKGIPCSEKTKKKISDNKKSKPGKPLSEETKRKISEAKKGKPNGNKGKPKSLEHRKHISESLIKANIIKRLEIKD